MKEDKGFIITNLFPILFLFALFFILPSIWGIVLSFFEYKASYLSPIFVGLENYFQLFKNKTFQKILFNTIIFVFVAVGVNIILSLLISSGICAIKSKVLKGILQISYFLPAIAPLSASAIMWTTIFNEHSGLLKIITDHFNMATIHWLSNKSLALYSVVILTLWADIGFNIIILMAGLDTIPKSYYEAAYLDGSGYISTFFFITLPLLSRTLFFIIIMTIISYFQAFAQFDILTKGGPQNSSNVLTLHLYQQGFKYGKLGYASGIATVLFIIIMIITLIQVRISKRDWEY